MASPRSRPGGGVAPRRLRGTSVLCQRCGRLTKAIPELAAGIDQPVRNQGLEHVEPPRAFSRGRQARRPELIQPQPRPKFQGQPTGTPLPRPPQLQLVHPDLNMRDGRRRLPIRRKQTQLRRPAIETGHGIDGLAPSRLLAVVNLTQIQQRLLRTPATAQTTVLHHAPVAMNLAILPTCGRPQKHACMIATIRGCPQGGRSSPQAFFTPTPSKTLAFPRT